MSEQRSGTPESSNAASPLSSPSVEAILQAYFTQAPEPGNPDQAVVFGTSGHRGKSVNGSFNEAHILAITQAVCEYRKQHGIGGPLYIGKDTHALSAPALETALEVLAANEVQTIIQRDSLPTPTPVISRAIIAYNREAAHSGRNIADGIVITPSHNPPEDGGFKYNESHGGPAGTQVTNWIEKRANELLMEDNRSVKRSANPRGTACITALDMILPYVQALDDVVDMRVIASSGLRLGADPMGGASLPFWEPIAEYYGINITVTNKTLDPLFSFMPPDHDGKTRMDCSSPWAMAGLISLADKYDLSFANDPDADRHGIVTPSGLMRPNDYLSVAVWYLLRHRPQWSGKSKVGKTAVSSSMLDRICASLGREIYETPVGFKWFVPGLSSGELLFGGEESAGASFLRMDNTVWTTDKDGILLDLLAAEMTAIRGKNPAELYAVLAEQLGRPYYARKDAPATAEQKKAFKTLSPESITDATLAGSPITKVLTHAPGNKEAIGGLKVTTDQGWFAARPSGTENIYKIYAESFISPEHLESIQTEAQKLVEKFFV